MKMNFHYFADTIPSKKMYPQGYVTARRSNSHIPNIYGEPLSDSPLFLSSISYPMSFELLLMENAKSTFCKELRAFSYRVVNNFDNPSR